MNKEIVPYEEAVQLEKLGFDESCIYVYLAENDIKIQHGCWNYPKEIFHNRILAPLYQQIFRWFRNKYKLNISIVYFNIENDEFYQCRIHYNNIYKQFNTYEECELFCLHKLIEIANERTNRKTI